MSKKKLLNETTIRRFGGLAGIKPISTSNFLSEMEDTTPVYARDEPEDELEGGEPGVEEFEIEDEEEVIAEPPTGGEEELVMSLLTQIQDWAKEHNVVVDLAGGKDADADLGDLEVIDDLGDDLGDLETAAGMEDELDMEPDMGDVGLEEMINSILSEDDEELTEEEDIEESNKPREAPTNESRRRTKSRGVKAKVLSDEKVIQEVTKRVKNRLARIAKAQKRRS